MKEAYDYYCTCCGETNHAENVLFDMDMLLTQDPEKHMRFLPLRMTLEELKKLSLPEDGEALDADGYRHYKMNFQELVELLSANHSRNLDEEKAYLRGLDLEEIKAFVNAGREEDYPELQALMATLLAQNKENMSEAIGKELLREELHMIANLFTNKERKYSFRIKLKVDYDDQEREVIVGYFLNQNKVKDNARVCRRCWRPLFRGAGTAEHRVVSFIGAASSGKTSIILGLTHYALHGLVRIEENDACKIWQPHEIIREITVPPELLNKDPDLLADLEWFSYGIAPSKTDKRKREKAYHVTMKFFNGKSGKNVILSLIDLPGVLFQNGKLNETLLLNEFRAALSSSALVTCFEENTALQQDITYLKEYTRQMQVHCQGARGDRFFIPNMLLFTKWDTLAEQNISDERGSVVYMLQQEEALMEHNDHYCTIKETFSTQLKQGYYAMMRCTAFGHEADTIDDVIENEEHALQLFPWIAAGHDKAEGQMIRKRTCEYAERNGKEFIKMRPSPGNIHILMQWILLVSGCLACEARHRASNHNSDYTLRGYYVDRLQFRTQNPQDTDEAMARMVLFRNIGKWDAALVKSDKREDDRIPPFLSRLFYGTQEEHEVYRLKIMNKRENKDSNASI